MGYREMVPLAARAAPSAKSRGGAAAMLKIVEAVFEGREWDGRGREGGRQKPSRAKRSASKLLTGFPTMRRARHD